MSATVFVYFSNIIALISLIIILFNLTVVGRL